MKNTAAQFTTLVTKIDRRHVQFALIILSLGLFILGAGAPMGDGGL